MLERHQDSFPSWFSLLPASRVLLLGWGWERRVEPQAPGAVTARPDRQGWDSADLDQQQHSFQWLPLGCQCLSLEQPQRRFQEDSLPRGTPVTVPARQGRGLMQIPHSQPGSGRQLEAGIERKQNLHRVGQLLRSPADSILSLPCVDRAVSYTE